MLPTTIKEILAIAKVKGDSLKVLNYKGKDKRMLHLKNTQLWELIVEVLNDGWKPKASEVFYEIWWKQDEHGFRCYRVYCSYWFLIVGSHQVFKNPEVARHAADHFISQAKKVYGR